MTGNSIVVHLHHFGRWLWPRSAPPPPAHVYDLNYFWRHPSSLPTYVTEAADAQRLLALLGPLDWSSLPERNLVRNWGQPTVPYAAFVAACLIKLNEGKRSMGELRQYLVEHPAVLWLCGFPPKVTAQSRHARHGFDADASLPTARHFTRLLRRLPNAVLQTLLADSVRLILDELQVLNIEAGDIVAIDTKHIIAWVKENNHKAYVPDRYDKTRQPRGDPDCRLGCKRQHNQTNRPPATASAPPTTSPTPRTNPVPAAGLGVGEYYWGYGSGVVVVPVPGYGDFVLAELTQPFDQADVSYFFPLMDQVEQRLGHKPRCGALDAAFDAWYVYAYFHDPAAPDAFAAVPFAEKGGYKAGQRRFTPAGLPLCAAGLPMPLKFTFINRAQTIGAAEWGRYVCPLLHPTPTGQPCPIQHKNFAKHGCTAQMSTSIGARLRYSLDRHSDQYKRIYAHRTAVERINSQAVALGIERPHFRNGCAIANINTLTYLLINLRFLRRLLDRLPPEPPPDTAQA
jgi:hypothetical protein